MGHLHTGELPLIMFFLLGSFFKIEVTEHEDQVFVNCNTSINYVEGTVEAWFAKNKTLNLGKGILDPRGIYKCNGADGPTKEESTIQIYYRSMCLLAHWDEIMGPLDVRTFLAKSRLW